MKSCRSFTFFILITTVVITACKTSDKDPGSQVKGYSPVDKELHDSIAYLDSMFFNAFNNKELDKSILIFFQLFSIH